MLSGKLTLFVLGATRNQNYDHNPEAKEMLDDVDYLRSVIISKYADDLAMQDSCTQQ